MQSDLLPWTVGSNHPQLTSFLEEILSLFSPDTFLRICYSLQQWSRPVMVGSSYMSMQSLKNLY